MLQRNPEEAMKAVAEATDQVVKEGGVIHEGAMCDAAEMALDGRSVKSMAERLKQEREGP